MSKPTANARKPMAPTRQAAALRTWMAVTCMDRLSLCLQKGEFEWVRDVNTGVTTAKDSEDGHTLEVGLECPT